MPRIYLMGFMGAGKSSLGKKLAKELQFDFYDLDDLIIEQEKQTIAEIFKNKGEPYFRKLETQVLKGTIEFEKAVIALGGGTPCRQENINWIRQHGYSIYLQLSVNHLTSRLLPRKAKRPLIADLSDEEIRNFVVQKLSEREVFYAQADLRVWSSKSNLKEIYKAARDLIAES
jgi:shikimate kinase